MRSRRQGVSRGAARSPDVVTAICGRVSTHGRACPVVDCAHAIDRQPDDSLLACPIFCLRTRPQRRPGRSVMARFGSVALGAVLVVLWIVGLNQGATMWLTWLLGIAGLTA